MTSVTELDTTEQLSFSLSDPIMGFLGGLVVKNLPANTGNMGLIPGLGRSPGEGNTSVFLPGKFYGQRSLAGCNPWGRSPGEGNGNPLQYSCLENFMDRGAWQAVIHGVAKSWA